MFNFPNTPDLGDAYQPANGPMYQWDGEKWLMTGAAMIQTPAYDQRNRIVNGAMQISQENGNTAGTTAAYYLADQWSFQQSVSVAVVTAGRGFASASPAQDFARYRAVLNVTTAKASLATTEVMNVLQKIEGIRLVDFNYGLPTAKQSVLRFGFRSNVAGTFAICLRNAAFDRSYVAPFTVSTAEAAANNDVWKTFVIPGDTTGTWAIDNTTGILLGVTVAGGPGQVTPAANQWVAGNFQCPPASMAANLATVGNNFQISNVGLYLDPLGTGIPPAWEMPDEAQELIACMRYFQKLDTLWAGNVVSAAVYFMKNTYTIPMRTTPAVASLSSGASGFPAASGLFSPNAFAVQENRTANATQNASYFTSLIACNARM